LKGCAATEAGAEASRAEQSRETTTHRLLAHTPQMLKKSLPLVSVAALALAVTANALGRDASESGLRSDPARPIAAPEKMKAAAAPAGTSITDDVQARYNRAREMASRGDPTEALQELLWCFDEGMVGKVGYTAVRTSFVLGAIVDLGKKYPPALTALRQRRDEARKQILAGHVDGTEIPDFAALNRELGEPKSTCFLFDQLPQGDRRRKTLALYGSAALLENRRYAEIMEAKTYAMMSSNFEFTTQERFIPASTPNAERLRAVNRKGGITSTAQNIEILAGAGDLVHARELAQRLLAYDDTAETRAAIQQHAERAGHPDLLKPAP
jgi:hypothetical protein